eukprot:m.148101 g.148101  ORF g.148101 m.148101 type:complete len:840 (-) comp11666_c0_seq29:1396-3915(-)
MSSEGAPGPPMRGSDVPVQNDKITQLQAELAEAKRKIEAVEASIQTAQSKVDRKGASEKVQESLYKAIAADKQTRATLEAKAFKLEGKIDDALNQAASGGKPPQQDASEEKGFITSQSKRRRMDGSTNKDEDGNSAGQWTGKVVFTPCGDDECAALNQYRTIGDHLRKKAVVPLQGTVDRIFKKRTTPKPFVLLDGPSGVGKSQQFFALSGYRVVYFVLSSWFGEGDAFTQSIYSAFAPLSNEFKRCVDDDTPKFLGLRSERGIVSTTMLERHAYSQLRTAGLVRALMRYFHTAAAPPEECLWLLATSDFVLEYTTASITDIREWLQQHPDHKFVFALDEMPPSDERGKAPNTFCRNLFRACGLTVVLAGTGSTLKNAFAGAEASRGKEEHLWAEVQVNMPPATFESVQLVCPKLTRDHQFLRLIESSRPLLAVLLATAALEDSTRSLYHCIAEVAAKLYGQKPKLRSRDGLVGQWLMFAPAYQKLETTGQSVANDLVTCHMADLHFVGDDGVALDPKTHEIRFFVRDSVLCLDSGLQQWEPRCSFRSPQDDPLLHIVLQGTHHQDVKNCPAFVLREGAGRKRRLNTLQTLLHLKQNVRMESARALSHVNPKALSNDGNILESLATTAWCVASHEMGIAGSHIDDFFDHLCTELSSGTEWQGLSVVARLSTFLPDSFKNAKMPYVFRPGEESGAWDVPPPLSGLDGCFGQLERPPNRDEHDIQLLLPDDVSDSVIRCSGEAKNHNGALNAGVLTPCIERVPSDSLLHFIFCNDVSSGSYKHGIPKSFNIRNPSGRQKSRTVRLLVVRRIDDKQCNLLDLGGGPQKPADLTVVVVPLASL